MVTIKYNFKTVATFLFSALVCVSCEDFLEVEPEDRIDANTFNSNEEELIISVNGVYGSFVNGFNVQDGLLSTHFQLLEARGNNVFMNHTENAERVATDIFLDNTSNIPVNLTWTALYSTVNLANFVIAERAEMEGDAALLDRIEGEARFLRAYNYFWMVNLWGGVPLRTEPTTDFDNVSVARSTSTEVYELIVDDLTIASQVLPNSYDGSSGSEVGRATRLAALTLLGKVQLQQGNTAEAITALRQVEGQFSLLPDYGDIYGPGINNSAESIFEVDFNPAVGTGSLNWQLIPNSVATNLGIVSGGETREIVYFGATQDLIDLFEQNPEDLRIPHTYGLLEDGALPGGYINKYLDLTSSGQGSDVNMVLLRYADVLLMLAEALGEGNEAYALINQIRTRAGLADIDATTPGTFMEKVMNERRLELAFEMHNWIDLLRLPNAELISTMQAQINSQQQFFLSFPTYSFGADFSLTDEDLLFPIPQSEIDISDDVVEQNPGY